MLKQFWRIYLYTLLPMGGLIWVMGCSSSTSGGGTYRPYHVEVSVDSDTLSNGEQAIVSCFLFYEDSIDIGETLQFSVASPGAAITPFAQSDNSTTGTDPTVYYDADSVTADFDTIYAEYFSDTFTLITSDYAVVRILP